MKNDFLRDRPALRRMVRYAEIVVVAILVAYAAFTWRELRNLRAAPVVLPAAWFIVTANVDQVSRVEAGGSWVANDGPAANLQTSNINCIKSKMQCMESSAQVTVKDGGLLETTQTLFDIESWTESEVVTKVNFQACGSRRLVLDIVNKQASSVAKGGGANDPSCKNPFSGERTFKLVAGQKVQVEAVNKAKPF